MVVIDVAPARFPTHVFAKAFAKVSAGAGGESPGWGLQKIKFLHVSSVIYGTYKIGC